MLGARRARPGDEFAAPMQSDETLPDLVNGGLGETEFAAVNAQLVVFARELGELYAMERARSAELRSVLEDLQETYLATIRSLASVVEAKDEVTKGHLDRTRRYGIALARKIAPSLEASPALGYGFFLHDIGKVAIPERILCKRGPLTHDEWQVMRRHPVIGAEIIRPIKFLWEAIDTIRYHHEWFDGSGYPEGLMADAIPLAARIFAVVDSFDAITNDRPYRPAQPIEHALLELRRCAGTQFDPDVVDGFVDLIREAPAPPPDTDLFAAEAPTSGSEPNHLARAG